jgi:D-alanyl-D-alanine carboxypeptidase
MTKVKWPTMRERDAFYGNPRGRNGVASESWKAKNLVAIKTPFKVTFGGKPVTKIAVHRKVAESLSRVLEAIWGSAQKSQAQIVAWGMDKYGGAHEFRLSRNSENISNHAYACAIDFDPVGKPNGQSSKRFAAPVVKAFADEGWTNLKNDPMHFEAISR